MLYNFRNKLHNLQIKIGVDTEGGKIQAFLYRAHIVEFHKNLITTAVIAINNESQVNP